MGEEDERRRFEKDLLETITLFGKNWLEFSMRSDVVSSYLALEGESTNFQLFLHHDMLSWSKAGNMFSL